ncbi:secreted RxLR effector protein 161-like [Benincasa hispida]|uniref:secreted RxLR effector protein 161-like n=1 Tax=Benincasa hispida TaxID=102211 RepID=UPI0019022465|nr:secreted RxLR effector protein 161-like [Benincasa hispida]
MFALKDLGRLTYFLGIQVHYLKSDFILNQAKYVKNLLHKLGLTDLKPAASPCTVGKHLSITNGQPLSDPYLFRSTIGALQYLTHTRLDIAHIVNHLSKFLKAPTNIHWQATKRVLRYISATRHHGLLFQPNTDLQLTTFSDANWASNIDDRKSIAAYCVYVDNNLISWSSKKQTMVARSNTKSEYRVLAHAIAEIIWLKQLMSELQIQTTYKPILWCDNISVEL